MLTAENLVSFRDKVNCTTTSQTIRDAYKRFFINQNKLQVIIAGKMRPVFYDDGRNIFLNYNEDEKKNEVTINYGPGLGSSTFFVGEQEANVVDSIIVWLIDTDNAFLYSSHKRCEKECVIKCSCSFHPKVNH